MNQYRILTLLAFLFLLLTACQNEPSPLPVATPTEVNPTEQPATVLPTATPIPPSATPEPTVTATATVTAVPTPTTIPNTIQSPETIQSGEMLKISGSWNRETAVSLQIIVQISDWILAEGDAPIGEDGRWEATLALPSQISGAATIAVAAADDTITNLLMIEAVLDADLSYVTLNNPRVGETAVSGYGIFFDGEINRPIGGTLVIGVLVDNCTRFATGQTFELGNGQWRGLLILPSDLSGNACAIARTGNPDEGDDWAAAVVPLPILPSEDGEAKRILLGNSGDLILKAGEEADIFGTAVHAPNNRVNLLLVSDDGSHILLAEEAVEVNSYGYWESNMILPNSYNGFALLTISIGLGENYLEQRIPIVITK